MNHTPGAEDERDFESVRLDVTVIHETEVEAIGAKLPDLPGEGAEEPGVFHPSILIPRNHR
jgi:hypothetical protein